MKLYQGTYIIPGLVIFLGFATYPIWYGAAGGAKPTFQSPPNPKHDRCIESKAFMRERHMQLLVQWRDEVVRGGDRIYTATDGGKWNKSLTQTCMACHGQVDEQGNSLTAATYCNQCHNYVGVSLYCWDCHVDPATLASKKPGRTEASSSVGSNGRRQRKDG